ncbi:tRNA (adenosine(37)-N6)-threonylcarbamoyltransferase complex ATPase subunit type 1 TsaE [Sphingobium sufflavum]|uniref:tRNA (adenosine(37)-N6)-threonylcarbamoyltransferase complex ATPase subunit type 1 TsaE n=1 Tax=Sphingobium sufflavum TaxID=1129547 RepID=UPI001EFFFA8C|nr:tRNA (adenosine(37)-N6)-threonylcarbamoyltransferase complex ATPase subunit type 1 TsaE [Sphingobium sufflavum]MCE7797049.1 tRNA (adenosine(37)-N6)-threonylcarbamoyltransferase complex ATPase subunit type 1 TsaE [Sphingobium sufflavum]
MRLSSAEAMEAFGLTLGERLRAGDIVALTGDLGAGKTTLARGLLRGLGHAGEVPSPSFAIVQPYEPPAVRLPLAHVDLYRLEDDAEVAELGLDEWLHDGALVVEWPARLGAAMLAHALAVDITVGDDGARVLTVTVPDAWGKRWPFQ